MECIKHKIAPAKDSMKNRNEILFEMFKIAAIDLRHIIRNKIPFELGFMDINTYFDQITKTINARTKVSQGRKIRELFKKYPLPKIDQHPIFED